MDLWEKFKKLNPSWDMFRFMPTLKTLIRSFMPVAVKLSGEYDHNDRFLCYLDDLMTDLRKRADDIDRGNDNVFEPAQKIIMGLLEDPAYHNYAVAFIALIRYGKAPPLTHKQIAWLRHRYKVEVDERPRGAPASQ